MSTYLVVTSTFWNHVSDLSHFVLPFFKERLKQKRFSDASRISRRGVLLLLCPALSTFFILNMMSWDAKWSASFDALLVMVLVGSWFILQKYYLLKISVLRKVLFANVCLHHRRLVQWTYYSYQTHFKILAAYLVQRTAQNVLLLKNAASAITLMLVTFSKSLL